jgi:mannitol-1-phosphate/altronate dehydrogenase
MGNSASKHLHIGAGRLGLGLVAAAAAQSGLEVIIAVEASPRGASTKNAMLAESRRFIVVPPDETEAVEIKIQSVVQYGEPSVEAEIRDIIADPHTVLVTTAVGDNLPHIVPLLTRLLLHRHHAGIASPLFIIAAENTRNSLWLREQIEQRLANAGVISTTVLQFVVFVPCVVDRVCKNISTATGEVRVAVEAEADWLVADLRDELGRSLESYLSPDRGSIRFQTDVLPFWRRKIYLLNGPHLLLAMLANVEGHIFLDDYLRSESGRIALDRVFAECKLIFRAEDDYFSEAEVDKLIESNKLRFLASNDLVARVLSRFREESDIVNFFRDFHSKVGSPALAYLVKVGGDLPTILLSLLHMISRISANRYVGAS